MDRQAEAAQLKSLYDARVPKGMSQAEFGRRYGIGTQGMVSQYLTGHTPLNVEAAAKFAKGLRCTIADISPDMARQLKVEIFPVLGRVSVKAAIALMLVIPPLLPSKAEAVFNNNPIVSLSDYTLCRTGVAFVPRSDGHETRYISPISPNGLPYKEQPQRQRIKSGPRLDYF